jgi:hypothetical protein
MPCDNSAGHRSHRSSRRRRDRRRCRLRGWSSTGSGTRPSGTALAAGSGPVAITLTGAVTMGSNAANTCQGASIDVPVLVTIASA